MNAYTRTGLSALPGVTRWLRRLRADLCAGRSCLWLLPQAHTWGPACLADALLDELLHELGDFLLLPLDGLGRADTSISPLSAPSQGPQWSGLAPLIDYDDGLSGFGLPAWGGATAESPARPAVSASPTEALARLLERLAKELPTAPGQSPLDVGGSNTDPQWAHDTISDVLSRLTGGVDGNPERRPIIVRSWYEAIPTAATHLLRRLVATIKEAGLPPDRRPRALVIATTQDLPLDLPDQLTREDVAVHWWWGATGRLDTATVVALTRPPVSSFADRHRFLESIAQATVTEVCGPFLELAASLAARWDGEPETLLTELRQAAADIPLADLPSTGRDQNRGFGGQPHKALLAAWSAGAVDSWDGRLRRHPAHDVADGHTVATRVWLAQNHALLPLIDDAREDFTGVVRRRARVPLPRLAERYGPRPVNPSAPVSGGTVADAITALELGAMWGAHLNSDIALTKAERTRLRTLWDARNRLAHRTPLDGDRLQRLVTELCR